MDQLRFDEVGVKAMTKKPENRYAADLATTAHAAVGTGADWSE
jgi:hypothetical protein